MEAGQLVMQSNSNSRFNQTTTRRNNGFRQSLISDFSRWKPETRCATLTPGQAKMTNDEFDQAIEAIRRGQITPRERRVMAAALAMIREVCSVPANWEPTNIQIVEFIDSLDKPFRRILKRVADDAKAERLTLH
jgi:hypothetical protein